MHRVTKLLLLLSVAPLVVTAGGCSRSAGSVAPAPSPRVTSATGTFAAYAPGATAVTYDQGLVPAGAVATVSITQTSADSRVWFTVAGLLPNRGYGVHLHMNPCGATGADAGPHYEHHRPPVPPSAPSQPVPTPAAAPASSSASGKASASAPPPPSPANPSYVNPQNEVWLDITTRADGRGSAVATHPWTFDQPPRSLVIHATPTKTGPADAGDAGARVACLTLPA
ncbi:superoxide dismutase [Dactylosporangium cerinum]|uniref:Superoxide dismutase n=1 Tax=Dactylosporangium cerinum TaxID=1434730 RepID=A0ABV9WGE8_9ACTN